MMDGGSVKADVSTYQNDMTTFTCRDDVLALLMELKYDKNVKTAADQVRMRNYPQALDHYKGNLLIVSVNYDKEARGEDFKKHRCMIERW